MVSNFILAVTILAEIFGIGQPTQKLSTEIGENSVFVKSTPGQVLGESSKDSQLPQIALSQINPLPQPIQKNQFSTRARSALVLDMNSNKILYQKNANLSQPIASITKLMTAVVILDNFNVNETVDISAHSAFQVGSKAHLLPGEQVSALVVVKEAEIVSGNDAAAALEEHYGQEKLVATMNEKAQFLGMTNSKFADATGLDSGNISNANDLVLLTRYAMKNKIIVDAVITREYIVVAKNGQTHHLIHTTNRLLNQYPDIIGVKTGFTNEAGNCLIAVAKQNKHQIVSIVLGVDNYDLRFSESRDLLDSAFSGFKW